MQKISQASTKRYNLIVWFDRIAHMTADNLEEKTFWLIRLPTLNMIALSALDVSDIITIWTSPSISAAIMEHYSRACRCIYIYAFLQACSVPDVHSGQHQARLFFWV